MIQVAGELSKYANVATDPQGTGMKFCIILGDGDYVEFVLHSSECKKLQGFLQEALRDEHD